MSGDQPHRVVFSCARSGLAQTLRQGLLGGYDGAGAWILALDSIRDGDEQLMVETHEGLHHELQASSGFGLVSAMVLSLAQRGTRPYALKELFHGLVDSSRLTHELFATTLSAPVAGIEQTRTILRDNPVYLGYLERGLALGGGPDTPPRYRGTAATAVLRCCMAPAGVFDLLELGFGQISRQRLPVRGGVPDERLVAFEEAGGAAGWPEEAAELDEDALLRQCYERTCAVLAGAGLPSVSWTEQEQVAHALTEAVGRADAGLAQRLNIVTGRRPVVDDGLEFDRQKVVLRERLPAEIIDLATAQTSLSAFVAGDADGEPHACCVWLSRRVAEKQFAIPPGVMLPDLLVALLAHARAPDGSAVVRLGLLPSSTTPRQCQDLLGHVPLLVLTTHYTLAGEATAARLRRVEPVFVLMDLPVAWHVDDWFRQGAGVRMALVPLEGVGAAELDMVAFAVDRVPGFRFVFAGSKAGVSLLVERLRRRHGDRLAVSGTLIRDNAVAFNLMLNHVFGAWHVLDQDAVE